MADPQLENGYTRISNELLEAVCRLKISGNEMRILLFIIRRTYGYGRKSAPLSLSEIAKAVSMSRDNTSRAVKRLRELRVIDHLPNRGTAAQIISVQKDYEQWDFAACCKKRQQSKNTTVVKSNNTPVVKTDNSNTVENNNTPVVDNDNNTYKRNIKENADKETINKSEKIPCGSYGNVLLTRGEYASLTDDFGKEAAENCIERMSRWLAGGGRLVGDHEPFIRMSLSNARTEQEKEFDVDKYKIFINNF